MGDPLPDVGVSAPSEPDYESAIGQGMTLRPFVVAHIPAEKSGGFGASGQYVIDDAMDMRTWKFRHVRSLRVSLKGGITAELVLFDDVGHLTQVLRALYYTGNTKNGSAQQSEDGPVIKFQWGWSMPSAESATGEMRITSNWHHLYICGLEVSYEDGGIAYRLSLNDKMSPLQGTTTKSAVPLGTTLRDAVEKLLTDKNHPYNIQVVWDKSTSKAGSEMALRFQHLGNNPLQIIRSWVGRVKGDGGKPIAVYWDSVSSVLVIKEATTSIVPVPDIYGPHDVNNWEPGTLSSGSKVLKFTPRISGQAIFRSVAQVAFAYEDRRAIYETLYSQNSNTAGRYEESKIGQGQSVRVPSAELGTKPTEDSSDNFQRKFGEWLNKSGDTQTFAAEADLELLGWPKVDKYEDIAFRFIWINVYNPYGIAGVASGECEWRPSDSGRLEKLLSGHWRVESLDHVIEEGTGYRLVLKCRRPGEPGGVPLMAEI